MTALAAGHKIPAQMQPLFPVRVWLGEVFMARTMASCAVVLILLTAGCAVTAPEKPAAPGSLEELARQSLAQIQGDLAVPGLREPVEVLRDEWGIPHIYARNTNDLFFAQGYVTAQDRLWQMEMWRRWHEGRLAEIFGPRRSSTTREPG